jgi:hypothetical protein
MCVRPWFPNRLKKAGICGQRCELLRQDRRSLWRGLTTPERCQRARRGALILWTRDELHLVTLSTVCALSRIYATVSEPRGRCFKSMRHARKPLCRRHSDIEISAFQHDPRTQRLGRARFGGRDGSYFRFRLFACT